MQLLLIDQFGTSIPKNKTQSRQKLRQTELVVQQKRQPHDLPSAGDMPAGLNSTRRKSARDRQSRSPKCHLMQLNLSEICSTSTASACLPAVTCAHFQAPPTSAENRLPLLGIERCHVIYPTPIGPTPKVRISIEQERVLVKGHDGDSFQ
ncbi:hypothetical protein [Nocardia sp. NPDC006630]|uniref:hypothetical protein n=1 Tax=Nocardia sp. NPDC006630 TaxID=3157181 RepID=UPI0033B2433D